MRMTASLMLLACLHIAAKSVSQVVTITAKNEPLKSVFREVSKQTGISILFNEKELQETLPVSLKVKGASVQAVMSELLKGQPLTYSIENKIIIIEKKKIQDDYLTVAPPADVAAPPADTVPTINIIGFVASEDNKFLSGATVMVKGTPQGYVTDNTGKFTLKYVPLKATLIVSSIGYETQEVGVGPVPKGLTETVKFITLKKHVGQLDETVIQAYGTTTKRKTTGNITTIKGEEIAKQPINNPLLALQGRVPGLVITPQSGYDFGTVKVEIRGRNAIDPHFPSDPLYIVDGVPRTTLELNPYASQGSNNSRNFVGSGLDQTGIMELTGAGGVSPFFGMNAQDISSIEVLKDADATAIYGSRGANGVILITTKKGKPGRTSFNMNLSQGVKYVTRHWDMLNTPQYMAMRREAYANDGLVPSLAPGDTYAPDILKWDSTRYTNWQKFLWGGTAKTTQASANMSGGTEQTYYYVSGGINRSTDINTVQGANMSASLSASITTHDRSDRFQSVLTMNYTYTHINTISGNGAPDLAPNAPAPFDKSGKPNWEEWRSFNGINIPFLNTLVKYGDDGNGLGSSLALSYKLLKNKNLQLRTNVGFNINDGHTKSVTPMTASDPLKTPPPTGSNSFGNTQSRNWTVEPQAQYDFGKSNTTGTFSILAGATIQNATSTALTVNGSGYTNDALLGNITAAPVQTATGSSAQYKYAGIFGRISYGYRDKYYVNVNGRRDGSSRFGPGNQFGNFGSLGVAWIVSDENWVRDHLPTFISLLKVRGSYGLTGSDAVGDYRYLSQWGNQSPFMYAYNGVPVLTPQIQPNADFKWQTNKKLEGALDLAFLDDKISTEIAWYRNRCDNQLISFPTPDITGFQNVTANSPANVQNSGWEFYVNAALINTTDLGLNFRFNISANRNKLLAYPDLDQSPYYTQYKVGSSLDNIFVYHFTGIDPATGHYTYEDHNHDGKIYPGNNVPPGTGDDDRYVAINMNPKYEGSFGYSVRWKGLMLNMDFRYSKRLATSSIATQPGKPANIDVWTYEHRWTTPGQIALTPRLTTLQTQDGLNFTGSDGYYTDASYIRLGTIVLGYQLKGDWLRRLHLNSMSANLSAQNIFVLTNYKGLDPEINYFGSMPTNRTITAGITCGF